MIASRPKARAVAAAALVGDAVVDLVGNRAGCRVSRHQLGEPREFAGGDHRAGRVCRAGDDQAVERARLGEQFRGRLIMGVLADRDQHRLDAERRQDVAIGRIAWHGEPDPVARFKGGEKASRKAAEEPVVTTTSAGSTAIPYWAW